MNEFDDRFKEMVRPVGGSSVDTGAALGSIGGRLAAARKRRQATRAALSGTLAVALVGAFMFLPSRGPEEVTTRPSPASPGPAATSPAIEDEGSSTTTTEHSVVDTSPATAVGEPVDPGSAVVVVGEPTPTPETTTGTTPDDSQAEMPDDGDVDTPAEDDEPDAEHESDDEEDDATDDSLNDWTQSSETTTCGTVTVRSDGDSVEYVSTSPNQGFSIEVSNSGPESVEVAMAGENEACEITARVVNGSVAFDSHVEDE